MDVKTVLSKIIVGQKPDEHQKHNILLKEVKLTNNPAQVLDANAAFQIVTRSYENYNRIIPLYKLINSYPVCCMMVIVITFRQP